MKIRDLMTSNPACCTPDTPLQQVADLMVKHDCGAIPVVDADDDTRAVGIVTDRDIVTRLVAKDQCPLEHTAADAMTSDVHTIDADAGLDALQELMETKQVRRVLVTQHGGHLLGIVAQADLARAGRDRETGDTVQHISQPA